jgi:hypothetical protein
MVGNGLHENEEWIQMSCNVHTSASNFENAHLAKTFIVFEERLYLISETPLLPSLASPNSAVFCLGA